jgi:hypothetical protein
MDLLLAGAAAPVTARDVVVHGMCAQAQVSGQERTWTCVPPGSSVRLGIDRDQDGCLDADDPQPDDPGTGCGG